LCVGILRFEIVHIGTTQRRTAIERMEREACNVTRCPWVGTADAMQSGRKVILGFFFG
jgi:hypothetical protein